MRKRKKNGQYGGSRYTEEEIQMPTRMPSKEVGTRNWDLD